MTEYLVRQEPARMQHIVVDSDNGECVFGPTLDAEQAEYAAMLLDAGVDREDVEYDLAQRAVCQSCGARLFAGQLDSAGRCKECQP